MLQEGVKQKFYPLDNTNFSQYDKTYEEKLDICQTDVSGVT